MDRINYIALDVHKKNIVMAESTKKGQAEIVGEYPNTDNGFKKMVKQLTKKASEYDEIKICYEAGPCGYTIELLRNKNEEKTHPLNPLLLKEKGTYEDILFKLILIILPLF